MAFKAGSVKPKPDLACIGIIESVGNVNLSKKGVYSVLPLKVKGIGGSPNADTWFIFRPEWFAANFDPETDMVDITVEVDGQEKTTTAASLHNQYRQRISDAKSISMLECLVASAPNGIEKLAEAFDNLEGQPDMYGVAEILREHLTGNEVGYFLRQRKDDAGQLLDQYEINKFFPATAEGLEQVTKSAASGRRKSPLVLTWDEAYA